MANLTVTFLLFFFVVSSSYARDLTDRPEFDVSTPDSLSLPIEDSDSKASILLPSDKFPEYESSKSIPENDHVLVKSIPTKPITVDTAETVSDPVVMISFRPINRHFGRRSVPLMFRRGRRGCHHRHSLKPWRLIDRVNEVSYGNDMIAPEELPNPNYSGGNWGSNGEIEIPSEFRHIGPYLSDWKEDLKHLHRQHFHHHHHHREEEHEDDDEVEHKEKSGFLTNFRKFLNQFEF